MKWGRKVEESVEDQDMMEEAMKVGDRLRGATKRRWREERNMEMGEERQKNG